MNTISAEHMEAFEAQREKWLRKRVGRWILARRRRKQQFDPERMARHIREFWKHG